ncbi:MAG: hypothetical protein ACP5I4_11110 [Oceanipulchritudo sp.]|jgi:hypothetical protein
MTDLPAKVPSVLRRKHKFSQALFDRVCSNILDGSNTHPAIEKEGISKRQFYRHVSDDVVLADKFKLAQNQRDKVRNAKRVEEAERELHRRAVEGWEEPVFDRGRFGDIGGGVALDPYWEWIAETTGLTLIPEPATIGLIVSFLVLGSVLLKRRLG